MYFASNIEGIYDFLQSDLTMLPETGEVKGIDAGVATPAADSDDNLYDHWKEIEDKIFELRRRLHGWSR